MDAGAIVRAAHEASAFAVRHQLDLRRGCRPDRIVATGGGVATRPWVQAIADGTGLPVDWWPSPRAARSARAWLARQVAGLEPTRCRRRPVGPDRPPGRARPAWAAATADRYARYRELAG